MSLFARPVSPSDLTQLQLGIEFATDSNEANAEANLITDPPGTPTVYSYAGQLLDRNISLSQVAMAVDSLMFGQTDNVTELTKLTTQILPAQRDIAVANGFIPTVYAAEALGLGLAGGNGTSTAFATIFGSLSAPTFAAAAAFVTGINSIAIEGWVNNWLSFYAANPSAHQGLSVTLAAYGAAFGDAVGTALLNPTVNGTLALLDSEVQNALIDNAEGRYQPGLALIAEAPHLPLQGEAFLIPGAGGVIDWAIDGAGNYAQFVAPAQTSDLAIKNAPSAFTLDTQHFGTNDVEIVPAGRAGSLGNLLTLILGDSTGGDNLGTVTLDRYSTVHIVVANGQDKIGQILVGSDLVISGTGFLGFDGVYAGTITDKGVSLSIGFTTANKIDAGQAPLLKMFSPSTQDPTGVTVDGVTVLGGTGPGNILQGSADLFSASIVTFSNGSTGGSMPVGSDIFIAGSGGGDAIFGGGSSDTIGLPPHAMPDDVFFGETLSGQNTVILAITDGVDVAYPGSWGANATVTAIPTLFLGQDTGGTSPDMTKIAGFTAGPGGDVLEFKVAAWNGGSTKFLGFADKGDLVGLSGAFVVAPGTTHLSAVWVNPSDNSSLNASDNVLRYAPSILQNAQQLAVKMHTFAVTLPGGVLAGGQEHILVAYDAGNTVNIADVDLVNTGASAQSSTANLHVYASDMVSLVGVSLASLASANIQFI